MGRRKYKKKSYDLNGVIEVVNITKGNRSAIEFRIIDGKIAKNIPLSGSIDIKSANYDTDESKTNETSEIHSGPG